VVVGVARLSIANGREGFGPGVAVKPMRRVDAIARNRGLLFVARGGGTRPNRNCESRDHETRGENGGVYFE